METGKLDQSGSSPLSHAADDPTEFKLMFAITGIFKLENHEAVGLPAITGVPRVGETLTADTSAITDENGTDRATFTYQWLQNRRELNLHSHCRSNQQDLQADRRRRRQANCPRPNVDDGQPWLQDRICRAALIDPTEPIQPEDLIVENTAVGTPTTESISSNSRQAQGFTASGDASPFTLTEVRFRFGDVDDPAAASTEITITLNEDSSGYPGDVLCTLTNPPRIEASATSAFGAPDSCQVLIPGQKYHMVLERKGDASGDIEIYRTTTDGQNPGSAPGWSLDYPISVYIQGSWITAVFQKNLLIDIRGDFPTEIRVPQGWSLTPSGLIGGDKFRLLFITFTGHSSADSDIENYNAYVQSQAKAGSAHTDIKAYSSWFRVLGSTEEVAARDNTGTTSSDTDAPIYWMGGDKVADNYADFYDNSWDSEMSSGRAGIPSSSHYAVWTGTENQGTRASS